mmetsp:Transcript_32061/g.68301  ORF Transcript_32061/g.68301 Transcript_32061/m.68301 type:complete len:157 (+) Transcript_32061:34-504(+)
MWMGPSGRFLAAFWLSLTGVASARGLARRLTRWGEAVVLDGSAAPHSLVARCSVEKRHMPKRPGDLAEWKDEAQECLTWCGALGDKCFRGCLDDCTGALGAPPCASFALEPNCSSACEKLVPAYSCLLNVSATLTHECHLKFNEATVPTDSCAFGH